MPTDLADSLKADEEERKTDHAPLVQVKENEEVAIVTATIETNLRQGMKGQMETDSNEKRRADELRSRSLLRRSSPQSMRRFLWPCDSTGGLWLRKRRRQHWWTCPQLPFFCSTDQGVQHVCTRFLHEHAWNCARQTTDRGLESQRHGMVNARTCARPTTMIL